MTIQQHLLSTPAPSFTPVFRQYIGPGSGTETAPAGASKVRIWLIGGGGAGAYRDSVIPAGYSGASGAACESEYAVSGGQTINYSLGYGGQALPTSSGFGGGSSATSGSLSITTMNAYGGNSGTETRANATANGGNINNYSGEWQKAPSGGIAGGTTYPMVPYSGQPGWETANLSSMDDTIGRGGAGAYTANSAGTSGTPGSVIFYYT